MLLLYYYLDNRLHIIVIFVNIDLKPISELLLYVKVKVKVNP